MAIPIKEDELSKRWDRCLADGLLKIGGGILVGAVSSLILFKSKDSYAGNYRFACTPLNLGVIIASPFGAVYFYVTWRSWPITTGAGFGLGLAYGNCERNLNEVLTSSPVKQKA